MDPKDALSSNPEVLSQTDVERLLAQVAEHESLTEVVGGGGTKTKCAPESIQPFDFRQPVFLSAGELRKLRLRQEDFARSLAARLSIYLRLDFALQMSRLQTVTYHKFIESLSNPTYLTVFKVEPLRGGCILDLSPQLGITMVDRLLGGPARSVSLERDLSDIEAALLDQAVEIVLQEWCNQWLSIQELRSVVLGHESSGRFLQTESHDTVMLVLALEARLGDCQEPMQMAFPCYTLEPLMRKLTARLDSNSGQSTPAAPSRQRWSHALDTMLVPISANWDELEMPARQVAQLKVGDVLPLTPQFANQIRLCLAGQAKFMGRLGKVENRWAVELTQVLPS
jgi:flagellar motor switch protein FliM